MTGSASSIASSCPIADHSCDDNEKLRTLLSSSDFALFKRIHARSLNMELQRALSVACLQGDVDAVRHLVDAGLTTSELLTHYENGNAEAPIAAQPLYLAAVAGHFDLARWLLQMGAN